jgi:hypothetical protein
MQMLPPPHRRQRVLRVLCSQEILNAGVDVGCDFLCMMQMIRIKRFTDSDGSVSIKKLNNKNLLP